MMYVYMCVYMCVYMFMQLMINLYHIASQVIIVELASYVAKKLMPSR